jgi:tetraprenyl-beta-curcumene synthase
MFDSTTRVCGQVRALLGAVVHELLWNLPGVAREVGAWRVRARTIPDAPLRCDALETLQQSRANADGAALFSSLAGRRDPRLLRLLVAYELMADFLDSVNERSACAGVANGRQLHLALSDALDPSRAMSDYYRENPWRESDGYLHVLVAACRETFASLPAHARVQPFAIHAAKLAEVQGYNHEPDPRRRDAMLERWATQQFAEDNGLAWFELTGAASAWLTVLALLAQAAESTVTERDGIDICASYLWISLLGTMLDSFGDMALDIAEGAHSYIAHYPSEEVAATRVCELVRYATCRAQALRGGHRHAVIVACMVAMYLSKDSARAPHMRARTASFVRAGGPLARVLVPVLRLWRIAYGQQTA